MDKPTCIVSSPDYLIHLTGEGHPESPARLEYIDRALLKAGLQTPLNTISPRYATKADILLCHKENYFHLVEREVHTIAEMGINDGSAFLSTGDAPICPESFAIALLAAGGILSAVDAVMKGKAKNAFCAVRPPGHHACPSQGMGFCIFNNIAIGARYAQNRYGIHRVLIVDWDVHHGNGTELIFYEDPSVFYFSTHQKGIYPGTGSAEDRGHGKGLGTTLNCPIEGGKGSREKVIEAFRDKLMPSMELFKPELVMISAGFDAHYLDPLGGFDLTDEDFGLLTEIVKSIADTYAQGRLVAALEGGYNLEALASATVEHVKALSL